MRAERKPFIYRVRHRIASWIYGMNIDIASDLKFTVGEIAGYHKAKREFLKTGQVAAFSENGETE